VSLQGNVPTDNDRPSQRTGPPSETFYCSGVPVDHHVEHFVGPGVSALAGKQQIILAECYDLAAWGRVPLRLTASVGELG
jgi:hypothetical protein